MLQVSRSIFLDGKAVSSVCMRPACARCIRFWFICRESRTLMFDHCSGYGLATCTKVHLTSSGTMIHVQVLVARSRCKSPSLNKSQHRCAQVYALIIVYSDDFDGCKSKKSTHARTVSTPTPHAGCIVLHTAANPLPRYKYIQ